MDDLLNKVVSVVDSVRGAATGLEYAYIAVPVFVIVILKILYEFSAPVKKMPVRMPGFGYDLIYSDARDKRASTDSRILLSEQYGLRGKPDFIYRKKQNGRLVPIELKSGMCKDDVPHRGDLMQLAAYFMLISDVYDTTPKYGYLVYNNCMFKINNTRALRIELVDIIMEMRDIISSEEIDRAANASFATCRYCICNGTVCEFSGYKR